MPRPTTKEQLLAQMHKEHEALVKYIDTLTPEQMAYTHPVTKWAVKDALAHLTEWEQMCLGWYKAGLRGQSPPLPAQGFNWAQLPTLNQQIYEKHRDRPLVQVLKQFRASYRQMLKTVEALSEQDLFTPGRYAWTKKNTLGAYFVSATSSHYHWALKEARKCVKKG